MAKKKDGTIQLEINSEEEWNELLNKPGLWVIDVYRDWSGPCICFQQVFKKIKNEVGDELLQFAMVSCDKVEQLAPFRETCEPQWLFVAGGEFVGFMRGTNVVSITKMIKEELEREHAVLDGKATRKALKRIQSVIRPAKSLADFERNKVLEEDFAAKSIRVLRDITKAKLTAKELINRPFTMAIIKPDAMQGDRVADILHEIKLHDIEILHQQKKILTEGEVSEVYRHQKHQLMVGGPSIVLVLAYAKEKSGNIVEDWNNLLGPINVGTARKLEPESLRAKFGTEGYNNALHGSDDEASAQRELKYFFPSIGLELTRPDNLDPRIPNDFIEYTFVMIRPHTLKNFKKDNIIRAFERESLQVLAEKIITFDAGLLKELYPYAATSRVAEIMLTGPSCLLVLCGNDLYNGRLQTIFGPEVVHEAKKKLPKSLRARFSKEERIPSGFHVSDNLEAATREINIFFPKLASELIQTRDAQEKKSKINVLKSYSKLSHLQQVVVLVMPKTLKTHHAELILQKIRDARFTIYAQKVVNVSLEQATQFFKQYEELFVFGKLIKAIASGPALAICVLCEDAINRVRDFLGPVEGLLARREAPTSLRGTFFIRGEDVSPFYMTENPDTLADDVALFFPEIFLQKSRLAITTYPQHCVLIISPHVLSKFSRENISQMCNDDELITCIDKFAQLSINLIEEFFFSHRADVIFNRTMQIFTRGDSLIIAIYMNDAIRQVNDSVTNGRLSTLAMNDRDAIHVRASVDIHTAKRDMEYFFPKETTLAIIKPDAFAHYRDKILQMIANVGLTIIGQCIENLIPDQVTSLYSKKIHEPFFPSVVKFMTSGKVLILALHGHAAVQTWQRLIGPTDPEVAREVAPNSIRALFGKDILENAVHGGRTIRIFEDKLNIAVLTKEILPEASSPALVNA